MIKKILPVMIGVALVGGMANAVADVTAMGHIDTAVLFAKDGGTREKDDGSIKDERTTNLVCTTCSFGFKGSEDLGNGLKAIFKIDFQYDTTERNKGLTDRDQWLGLGSNLGKLRIGTISTSYKSHGAMLDPIYRTVVQGRDIGVQSSLQRGAGESGQGRATNTFRYDSPTFAGITATGHYTLQNDTGADTDNPWGIGAQWKAGGFLAFADYITSDADGDNDAYKIGGRFGFSNFAIFGQYEVDGGLISTNGATKFINSPGSDRSPLTDPGSGDGADVWFIGGTAGFGNNLIYASYGQGKDTSAVFTNPSTGDVSDVDTGYDAYEVVGVHSLSKRTKIYAGYAGIDPDDKAVDRVDLLTLGMKHVF